MATVTVKHQKKTNAAADPSALVDGPTWDNDPHVVTGLDQVDNTSDVNKPVSTAQAAAIALKANIASPTFTGTPAAPTATVGTNTTQLATTAFVLANTSPPGGSTTQVQYNNAGAFAGNAGLAYAPGGALTIAPTAVSNNSGLVVSQSTPTSGTVAGPISGNLITFIDGAQTVTGGALDNFGQITNQTDAFRINYRVTGGTANHFGLNVVTDVTATNGGTAAAVSSVGSSVTGTITGDWWANIAFVRVGPTTNLNQTAICYEAEALVATGGTLLNRIGFSANSQGPVAATGIDAAFCVNLYTVNASPYNGAASWKTGIYFSNNLYGASQFPVATTGNIILADTGTVANFISAHTLTVTGNILDFPNVQITGGGAVTLTTGSAGAFRIGPNGVTNPTFQVDTSATSAANGVYIFSTAAGSGAGITTISSATNEGLTINAKGAGVITIGGVSTGGAAISGDKSGGNAAAGFVGEYVESVIASGSAVSLVTSTPKTITSISLTAGDWDVDALIQYFPANTTQFTALQTSLSLTTNSIDTTPGRYSNVPQGTIISTGSFTYSAGIVPYRFSLASTTTIFVIADAVFTVSTMTAFGILRARRVR